MSIIKEKKSLIAYHTPKNTTRNNSAYIQTHSILIYPPTSWMHIYSPVASPHLPSLHFEFENNGFL